MATGIQNVNKTRNTHKYSLKPNYTHQPLYNVKHGATKLKRRFFPFIQTKDFLIAAVKF